MFFFPGFRSLNLLQNVTSTVNEVCRRLKSEDKPTLKTSRMIPHSVNAVKNGRRKMEDRHVVVHDVNVIYSGHANQVSDCHLLNNFKSKPKVWDSFILLANYPKYTRLWGITITCSGAT
jgi:hypothetical protein